MTNDIDVLNDITKTLIDSHKGYETACEASDDSFTLQQNFQQRARERSALINEFQAEVRALGGTPETDGSAAGTMHRAWTNFTTLFADDERAAVEAVDDGEEYLAEKIEDCLKDEAVAPRTRALLQKAHTSAREGERFADTVSAAM